MLKKPLKLIRVEISMNCKICHNHELLSGQQNTILSFRACRGISSRLTCTKGISRQDRDDKNTQCETRGQHQLGYMLLEVMVSVLLVSTALIFLTARISQSIQGSSLSEEITVATRLAQGGAEWLKGWRDDVGWSALFLTSTEYFGIKIPLDGNSATYCWDVLPLNKNQLETAFGTCGSGEIIDGLYYRELTITRIDASRIKYEVNVSWKSGRKDRVTNISGELLQRQL